MKRSLTTAAALAAVMAGLAGIASPVHDRSGYTAVLPPRVEIDRERTDFHRKPPRRSRLRKFWRERQAEKAARHRRRPARRDDADRRQPDLLPETRNGLFTDLARTCMRLGLDPRADRYLHRAARERRALAIATNSDAGLTRHGSVPSRASPQPG